jgi:hypothetical protein
MGNWLVDITPGKETKYNQRSEQLTEKGNNQKPFDDKDCADSIAEGLHRPAATFESWALKNVRPGIVVEELFTNIWDRSLPPFEFSLFVVWGRVYITQWVQISSKGHFLGGFFYRDGSPGAGCYTTTPMPDYIPYKEMIEIAEKLGANKDMIR